MTTRARWFTTLAVLAAVSAAALLPGASLGHAAGMAVSSRKLSTFRPSNLPPQCTSTTVVATADTWVTNNNNNPNANGSVSPMTVGVRNGRVNRGLVSFPLPAPPSGCSLASATLRLHNTNPTLGRTILADRATAAWTEADATWPVATAVANTPVDRTSAAGLMDWVVTPLVQAMYAGTNNGFVIHDSNEATSGLQSFATREATTTTTHPELVLQWGS